MKRTMILAATALAVASGPVLTAPAFAQSQGEVRDDRRDLHHEQRQLDRARGNGDRGDIRDQRGDVRDARRELRDDRRDRDDARRGNDRRRDDYRVYRNYDYNRPDPRFGDYRPERYYRAGNYPERRLGYNDRVYRGGDGRYYCRRDDGTTGLIVGALGGGVLGNAIAPGGSKTLGTVLGGGLGALLGRSIDRGGATCR